MAPHDPPNIREMIDAVLDGTTAESAMTAKQIMAEIQARFPHAQHRSIPPRLSKGHAEGVLGRTLIPSTNRRAQTYVYWKLAEGEPRQVIDIDLSDEALFDGEERMFSPDLPEIEDTDPPGERPTPVPERRNNAALPFTIQASNIGLIGGITIHATPDGIPTEIVIELAGSQVAEDRAVHAALRSNLAQAEEEIKILRQRLAQTQSVVDALQPLADQASGWPRRARALIRGPKGGPLYLP